ncbi:MAG: hypothetical protein A2234_08510 [Elusimicrobia bacterium RIFOXYA2_FULL_58_8]|nr:MAG: hypothetical protein A2234_08510 [Elusimicrobia bacterium RIFOXYA2_FULL_58_8]OGS12834.1 MAG: hypothetical protein A2285_03110 [Elusimicrobia bacterium RIFOXYA12_FULL_57_11]
MKIKELMRDLIIEEIYDISLYTIEAELFGDNPEHGERIRKFFGRLADEKRARLKDFDRISRERTGFRQRHLQAPRSIEAALRAHVNRTEQSISLYSSLIKLINKPEYREAFGAIIVREREVLVSLRELQAAIKGLK